MNCPAQLSRAEATVWQLDPLSKEGGAPPSPLFSPATLSLFGWVHSGGEGGIEEGGLKQAHLLLIKHTS